MKHLLVAASMICMLALAVSAGAMGNNVKLSNQSETDIYSLWVSPSNANDWEENLLEDKTLPNGDTVNLEMSRTEKAEAWDIKVVDKQGNELIWLNVPLNKSEQVVLLPDGQTGTK